MITSAQIVEIIRNPALAGKQKPEELTEIRDKFSYCSTLHLICLKAQSMHQGLDFENQLRFAAAHVMDRERMYYLIQQKSTETAVDQVVNISGTENQATLTSETVFEEPVEKELLPVAESAQIALSTEPETPEIPLETDLAEVNQAESLEKPDQQSNKDLLEAAPDLVNLAYESELTEILPVEHQPISEESHVAEPELQEEIAPIAVDSVTEPTEESKIAEKPPGDLSFTEWLKVRASHKAIISPEVENTKKEVEPNTTRLSYELTEELPTGKKQNLSRDEVDALLNKFIAEEPSISKPKTAFFSPSRSAKQSLEESNDLVTETLAKIYFLQKNYSKAIRAYEQLSLVYPEKKVFFAAQIEKIKEEQIKNLSK